MLLSYQPDHLRQTFWRKTGCLLIDGSENEFAKPEGLPGYKVPPPSLVEPIENDGKLQSNNMEPVGQLES